MSTNRKSPDASGAASGRVVVGVHGSRSSLRALRQAAEIARDRGWDLEMVTAWPDADDPLIHDVPGRYIAARGHAVECQREALATLVPWLAAAVDTFLINARPAEALISRCDDADLLVVGAGEPESALRRRSVTDECLEAAPCAVRSSPTLMRGRSWSPRRGQRGIGAAGDRVARRPRSVTRDGRLPLRGPAERPAPA